MARSLLILILQQLEFPITKALTLNISTNKEDTMKHYPSPKHRAPLSAMNGRCLQRGFSTTTLLIGIAVAAVLIIGGFYLLKPSEPTDSKAVKAGWVTVGPVSDWGWNYQHNQGRLALEKKMGDNLTTSLAENTPENADAARLMQRLAADGADVVFSTSYGYADFCVKAAKKNPDTIFMQAQAPVDAPNAATFNGAIWEASYLAGVVAAMSLPDETRYGFVGAHPIPPIKWTVNAFALGARSVNPAVTVDIVYTNSWNDPAAETEAVNSLVKNNVKVVYALVDSTLACVQAAERAGIYSISHHADLLEFAPKGYITGAIWQWGALYEDVVKQVIDGTWKPVPIAGGFKEGYVGLASFGPVVDKATREKAEAIKAQIASGEINVFAGPIRDAEGTVRVTEGESLNVPQIVSMDWVAEGVREAK